jgi:peptidoglycan/xylan/chitin deacetylase (PgdA/CDA1 family)
MIKTLIINGIITPVFSKIPFTFLNKVTRQNIIIPNYHIVSDEEVLHIKHLYIHRNIKQFKNDLEFFLKYFIPISLFDLIDKVKNNVAIPKNSFLLTFDDGFREMYDVVFPILKEKGIPATFFLSSALIDNKQMFYRLKASLLIEHITCMNSINCRNSIKKIIIDNGIAFNDIKTSILTIKYNKKHLLDEIAIVLGYDFKKYLKINKPFLSAVQIEELIENGFTIGAHSVDHPLYSLLSLNEQLRQTRESIRQIKERFKINYSVFAFPHMDNGVSKQYYKEMFDNLGVDISFGTSGMINDVFNNNLHRIKMENSTLPAEKIIAEEYVRKLYRIIIRKDEIVRT